MTYKDRFSQLLLSMDFFTFLEDITDSKPETKMVEYEALDCVGLFDEDGYSEFIIKEEEEETNIDRKKESKNTGKNFGVSTERNNG